MIKVKFNKQPRGYDRELWTMYGNRWDRKCRYDKRYW